MNTLDVTMANNCVFSTGTRLGRQSNIIKLSTLAEHNMNRKLKNLKEIPAEMPKTRSSSMDSCFYGGDTSDGGEEAMDEGMDIRVPPQSASSQSRFSDSTPPYGTPGDTPPWGGGPPFNGQNHSHSGPASVSSHASRRESNGGLTRRESCDSRDTRSKTAAAKCSRSWGSSNSRHSPPPSQDKESMAIVVSKKVGKRHSLDRSSLSQTSTADERPEGPPASMGGPPVGMGGPPVGMGGPPAGMGGPPAGMGMGGPPGGGPPGMGAGPPMGFPPGASREPCNIVLDLEVFNDKTALLDSLVSAFKVLDGILNRVGPYLSTFNFKVLIPS